MGIIASIRRQSQLSYSNNRAWNRDLLCRRSEIEADMNNKVSLRKGLSIAWLQSITVGITTGGYQAGDTDVSSGQGTSQVAKSSIDSNDRRLRRSDRGLGKGNRYKRQQQAQLRPGSPTHMTNERE
jgi:hypothetical protein